MEPSDTPEKHDNNSDRINAQGKDDVAMTRPLWQLRPSRVLAPPHMSLLPQGLPALGWGSDHISLLAVYDVLRADSSSGRDLASVAEGN